MAQETVAERQAQPTPEGTYRSVELDWLEQHQDELAARYAGEWLAVDGPALVAHATTLEEVVRLARERGHPHPFITAVASEPIMRFVGHGHHCL